MLTAHAGALVFLQELRTREQADSRIGALDADSFSASLLGWLLDGYLDAVSAFEANVDRLEVGLLTNPRHHECLPELASLRRDASHLRRLLAPHRAVFGAMARPDFRPDAAACAERHFRALEQRFERAIDAAENARDLLVGTFELYSTRSAERTNDTMRMLTFATVLLGTLAVFAGVLGMNFQVAFFETGARGFWIAVAGMSAFAAMALVIARWRRWI
ncbi:MAG TPA: CorA family divalent cation transporter [Thermomonas sp.]|nr:CorA family divalent cation transporter [Thermomonas sp.]